MTQKTTDEPVLTLHRNGTWRRGDIFMAPLTLYAVVANHGGEWEWFDFSSGGWSGVVDQQCVVQDKAFAESVAAAKKASLETYSLVRHPHADEVRAWESSD